MIRIKFSQLLLFTTHHQHVGLIVWRRDANTEINGGWLIPLLLDPSPFIRCGNQPKMHACVEIFFFRPGQKFVIQNKVQSKVHLSAKYTLVSFHIQGDLQCAPSPMGCWSAHSATYAFNTHTHVHFYLPTTANGRNGCTWYSFLSAHFAPNKCALHQKRIYARRTRESHVSLSIRWNNNKRLVYKVAPDIVHVVWRGHDEKYFDGLYGGN